MREPDRPLSSDEIMDHYLSIVPDVHPLGDVNLDGIVNGLEATVSAVRLGQDLAGLGQNMVEPPTADGWPGGCNWINSATSLGRTNLACALLALEKPYAGKIKPLAIAKKYGHSASKSIGPFLLDLFLQGDVDGQVRQYILTEARTENNPVDVAQQIRQMAHLVVTLPEFQLA